MEKLTVGCQHCRAKYKVDPKNMPELGHVSICPNCDTGFTMWHPDAYYLDHFPREYAVFILDQKRLGHVPTLRHELKRIKHFEKWLINQDNTLLLCSEQNLFAYVEEIKKDHREDEAERIKTTLGHFFDCLVRDGMIQKTPLPTNRRENINDFLEKVEGDYCPIPPHDGPHATSDQTLVQTRGHRTRWVTVALVLALVLAVGGVSYQRQLEREKDFQQEMALLQQQQAEALEQARQPQLKTMVEEAQIEEDATLKAEALHQEAMAQAGLLESKNQLALEQKRRLELTQTAQKEMDAIQADRHTLEAKRMEEQKKIQEAKAAIKSRCQGDCQNGIGDFTYDNGEIYRGGWKNGQRWGRGTLIQPNGDSWVGMWREDKRMGVGSRNLVFAEYLAKEAERQAKARVAQEEARAKAKAEKDRLQRYEKNLGNLNDMKNSGKKGCVSGECETGQGTYIYANGDTYSGSWRNGAKDGEGRYLFHSGGGYSGTWKNDQKHGQGTYTFKNGQQYVGGWLNDEKHGDGVIIFSNGKRVNTKWNHGQRVMSTGLQR